jgi:pectin methylesterase-like acyl-CoA thioesterase
MGALRWFLLSPFLLGTPAASQAATYEVPADFSTIQAAINAATHGVEIVVATGTYKESLQFMGKNIVLRSTDPDDTEVVADTILINSPDIILLIFDPYAIQLSGTEDETCVIEGLTIAQSPIGIQGLGSRATIRKNDLTENRRGIEGCDGIIEFNRIRDGDAAITGCSGILRHNEVYENEGIGFSRCSGLIENNLIYNNECDKGSGCALVDCNGTIQNNTIVGNIEHSECREFDSDCVSPGIHQCDGVIRNNIVWGNEGGPENLQITDSSPPDYCCIQNWNGGGEGNIFSDPRFVNDASGDYRLSPTSFCIDSGSFIGDLAVDFDGNPRGVDSASDPRGDGSDYDIGAYEFEGVVSPNTVPGQPVNLSPVEGAVDLPFQPTLVSSGFSDPDPGEIHTASQWQIDDDPDFGSPEFDSGSDPIDLLQIKAIHTTLVFDSTYYWRVRHMDTQVEFGPWSEPTSFSTFTADWTLVPDDHPTIQAALDGARPGDVIGVRAGRYIEIISFPGFDLTLRSLDPEDQEVVDATIIDASGMGTVVTFAGTETLGCQIDGFTITGGSLGGIRGNNTNATIRRNWITGNEGSGLSSCDGLIVLNRITNNEATFSGGGLSDCDGLIASNTITKNIGNLGGGLYQCDKTIWGNRIDRNVAKDFSQFGGRGGGLQNCHALILNNLIHDNDAYFSGGAIDDSRGLIAHNTFYFNRGESLSYCRGTLRNNIHWDGNPLSTDSSTPSFSLIFGWEGGGEGNFWADPRWLDSGNRDFRLEPDSPCIDAGGEIEDVESDIVGNPRPQDSVERERGDGSDFDIGAYEFVGSATPNPLPGRPINLEPPEGATNVPLKPTLIASEFMDEDPEDSAQEAQWQISDSTDFEDLVLNALDTPPDFKLDDFTLSAATDYFWRVRYLDRFNGWSEWSEPTRFTTRPVGELAVPGDFPTIQEAIDNSVHGDEVVVSPGTYREFFDFKKKRITVRSTDPTNPSLVALTIIEDNIGGTVAHDQTINFTPDINTSESGTLAGFTIYGKEIAIHGQFQRNTVENCVIKTGSIQGCGGNIRNNRIECEEGVLSSNALIEDNLFTGSGVDNSEIFGGSSMGTVRNNVFTGLSMRAIQSYRGMIERNMIVDTTGGACFECTGTIRANIIANNSLVGSSNHRVGLAFCDGTIDGNLIYGNRAEGGGGGISSCDGDIKNNIVVFNSTKRSAAAIDDCHGRIYNNVVAFNSTDGPGGGLWFCSGDIKNNIMWGNTASVGAQILETSTPEFCCIQDWVGGGNGNISVEPRFVDSAGFNFRLLPSSRCIDAGTITEALLDFDGRNRPYDFFGLGQDGGAAFDMGAYEFRYFENDYVDLIPDFRIDFLDLFTFSGLWHDLIPESKLGNMNEDAEIDALDLIILLTDWGQGTGVR